MNMKKASVLYLFHTQSEISAAQRLELGTGLYKGLKRLGLNRILLAEPPEASAKMQVSWAQAILLPFAEEHGIAIEAMQSPVPREAPEETCLWILDTESLKSYLSPFTPPFQAKDQDLVVINTQKEQYRSLSF